MEKGLECDLKYFSVSEILQLMDRFKKTGKIEIEIKNKKGEIYVFEGRCVHSTFGNLEGIDAIYEMAQFVEGKLTFYPSVISERRTVSAPFTVLKDEIERRSFEIRGLREKLPSLDTVMVKTDKPPSELTLRKTDWKILTLIDGKKNLREVIESSGLGLLESFKSLAYLSEKGLIVDPKESEKAKEGLIRFLNEWLKELSGEVETEIKKLGEFIIENLKKTNPTVGNSIIFGKEFSLPESLNLSFKDVEEIKRSLEETLRSKLEEIYGKVLAEKKIEVIKKKL
ncbi:MAG: DUF4388 domain-containing protein [Candidatus Hydrothermales bacterium]